MPDAPASYERFGGELPLGCDPAGEAWALPGNVLAFSHGRSALSWFVAARGPFASAALCAYTCPSVPEHMARLGVALGFFDYGADDLDKVAARLPGRCLVLVPAPFGLAPWLDAAALARRLGDRAVVVIDAAQTAFGALDFAVPPGGAVLSCPRKALAVGDGALLAVEGASEAERAAVTALPAANEAAEAKQAARALFAASDPAREAEALTLAGKGETALPSEPRRMSEASRNAILRTDAGAHRVRRRGNARRLMDRLGARVEFVGGDLTAPSVPFNVPILTADRARLLADLRVRRVFATALWPDAVHDPAHHPRAADLARRLVALPSDQRHDAAEIDRLADRVIACL